MSDSIGTIAGAGIGFAIGGPAGAAMGASLGGGLDSRNAQRDAAEMQTNAANYATDQARQAADKSTALQERMYNEQVGRLSPWLQSGQESLARLRAGLQPGGQYNRGFTFDQTDPSYNWRYQQGQRALEAGAAAHGGMFTAGQQAALQNYGQNMASQEYNNAFNRYQTDINNRFNRESTLANNGQNAGANLGAAGQNFATNNSNLWTGFGQTAGANAMGAANVNAAAAIGGARDQQRLLGDVAGWGMNQYNNNPNAFNSPFKNLFGNSGGVGAINNDAGIVGAGGLA